MIFSGYVRQYILSDLCEQYLGCVGTPKMKQFEQRKIVQSQMVKELSQKGFTVVFKKFKEVTVFTVLKNNVNLLMFLKNPEYLDDVGMRNLH